MRYLEWTISRACSKLKKTGLSVNQAGKQWGGHTNHARAVLVKEHPFLMADPRQPRKRVDARAPGKDKGAHGDGNVPCAQTGRGKLGGAVDLAVGKGVDEEGDECCGESLSVNMGT